MLKSSAKIFSTLSQTLPDDRPITAIQIIEHAEKCPVGFIAISRTYDQDQDADLWREHSIFMRKQGRYLCLSKTEGLPNYVVQEIAVLGEKELPPEGYSLLHKTADTEQRAWRKRQLVYKLTHVKNTSEAITDIIVCSRLKHAPTDFTFAGEINGMTLFYKMGSVVSTDRSIPVVNNLPNGKQTKNGSPIINSRVLPERPPKPGAQTKSLENNTTYPLLENNSESDHDYETLLPSYLQPSRPAPQPPASTSPMKEFSMFAVYNALDGIPFVLNPKLVENSASLKEKFQIPAVKKRTMLQIEEDYAYDFSIERQT